MNDRTNAAVASVPFIDVAAQRQRLGRAIDDAVARVLNHCQFILGPEVKVAEEQLAVFCGTRHAITCASGTDALLLPLMAKGIGPGDAVICPSFTFCATAEVVALAGATPVFADVDEATFNLDPKSIGPAITASRRHGLNVKAIIPVDLFGQPADHAPIADIARGEGLFVLDDAAQALGATYRNWFYPPDLGFAEHPPELRAALRARIEAVWDRIDAHLRVGGPYLLGAELSMADLQLLMYMRWSRNMPRPALGWPALAQFATHMRARTSWQRLCELEGLTEWRS
jgi:hypothetical protein